MSDASDGEAPLRDLEAWRERARRDLAGAPLERLLSRTRDGLAVEPLYTADNAAVDPASAELPGAPPFLRGAGAAVDRGRWQICPRIDAPTIEAAAEDVRVDLGRGADGLWIRLDEATMAGDRGDAGVRSGVEVERADDLGRLLAGVDLAATEVVIEAGVAALPVGLALVDMVESRGGDRRSLRAAVGGDLLATAAMRGGLGVDLEGAYGDLARWTAWAAAEAPAMRTVILSTIPFADAGASAAEELAILLCGGLEALRRLERAGLGVDVVGPRVLAAISIGRDLLLEVAKVRAARLLWARMIAACGGGPAAQALRIHGEGAWRELTRVEPWVNLLRGATQASAGAIAGVWSMSTQPFTAAIGEADADARRLAINTQLLLREESHLDRVIDPGGGAYAIESLTDAIARAAWARVQAIEGEGGLAAAISTGSIQARIAGQAQAQAQAVAAGREPITGVSRFASLGAPAPVVSTREAAVRGKRAPENIVPLGVRGRGEEPIAAIQAALRAGASLRAIVGAHGLAFTVPALGRRRLAADFESLREAGALALPLLCVGALAAIKPRIDFMRALLASGGLAAAGEAIHPGPAEALAAFQAAPAPAVVLCAADPDYPALVPALIPGLRAAGARLIAVAGRPRDQVAALEAAGVDLFFALGADALEPLRQVRKVLSQETEKEGAR